MNVESIIEDNQVEN